MVFFNYALRKLNTKIVYYGPGLCGKTTNLQWIHDHFEGGEKGKMVSLATEGDRTIFFDLLPLEIGTIRGMDVTLQLYTVPGQVHYNATRQLVLRGADGVVFVADSQRTMKNSNIDSLKNLEENLLLQGVKLGGFPHVLQFNKRDLGDVMEIEELDSSINTHSVPFFEAVATEGIGVEDTLGGIVKLVMRSLRDRYEVHGDRMGSTTFVSPQAPAAPVAPVVSPTWGPPSRPAAGSPQTPGRAAPPAEFEAVAESPREDLLETKPSTEESSVSDGDVTGVYTFDSDVDSEEPASPDSSWIVDEPTDPSVPVEADSVDLPGASEIVPEVEIDGSDKIDTQTGILFPSDEDDLVEIEEVAAVEFRVDPNGEGEPAAMQGAPAQGLEFDIDDLDETEEEILSPDGEAPQAEASDPFADTIPPESPLAEELMHRPASVSPGVEELLGSVLGEGESSGSHARMKEIDERPKLRDEDRGDPDGAGRAHLSAETVELVEEIAEPEHLEFEGEEKQDVAGSVLPPINDSVEAEMVESTGKREEKGIPELVFVDEGDPFMIETGLPPAVEVIPAAPSVMQSKVGDNSIALKLTGTGAIVESGEVRAMDIEVPVPGSWIGNRRVTLQLRLTLSPAAEEEDE